MKKTDRRSFIAQAGVLSLTAFSGVALLQACSGGTSEVDTSKSPSPKPSPSPSPAAAETQSSQDICAVHNADLTEADLSVRKSLSYIELSEIEDQNCRNCRFYMADKFEGPCGGCQLFVNGAVSPKAWCKSWAAS